MTQRRLEAQGPNTRYLEGVANRLAQLLVSRQRCDYELGRVIDEIMTGEYWTREDWPGSPEGGHPKNEKGFNAWCLNFLGFKYRKAYYFRRIYQDLSALRLPENGDTFSRALRIGWTKLAEVLRVAKDETTLVYWLNRIDNEGMTADQIKGEVKIALGSDDDGESRATPRERTGTTLDDDGPVDPETGEPLVAGAHRDLKPENEELPAGAKKKAARVEWPLSFEKAEDVRTFIKALDIAKLRMGTDSNGEAAVRVALYYLSNHPQAHEGGPVAEVEEMIAAILSHRGERALDVEGMLRAVEKATGLRLRVEDPSAPVHVPVQFDSPSDAALEGFGA